MALLETLPMSLLLLSDIKTFYKVGYKIKYKNQLCFYTLAMSNVKMKLRKQLHL